MQLVALVLLGTGAMVRGHGQYNTPPPAVQQILDAPAPATASISANKQWVIITERDMDEVTIEELAEPRLNLAGVRFTQYPDSRIENEGITRLTFRRIDGTVERVVVPPPGGRIISVEMVRNSRTGGELAYSTVHDGKMALHLYDAVSGKDRLVATPGLVGKIANLEFTMDGAHLAFTAATREGVSLWIADAAAGTARKVQVNHVNGSIAWTRGHPPLVVRALAANRQAPPEPSEVPTGPIVQESFGRSASAPTFQNLLKSAHDEALYEYYFTNQIVLVDPSGKTTKLGQPGIHQASPSPDGKYLLVQTTKRPYSYQVPGMYFPQVTAIWNQRGEVVKVINEAPLRETVPMARDAVLPGRRQFGWRADAPATLTWVEALDEGNPRNEVPKRDRVFTLAAPFTAQPAVFAETEMRFGGIAWAFPDLAFLLERSQRTTKTRTWIVNPSGPTAAPRLLFERSTEDIYSDPGTIVMTNHPTELRAVPVRAADGSVFLSGAGAAKEGARPFLDRLDLRTLRTTRLWQSAAPFYESLAAMLDDEARRIVISRESPTARPDLFLKDMNGAALTQLTSLPDPAPWFATVKGEQVKYKRADGTQLSATLYLPPGYDQKRDGPLPFLLWAYPREFLTEEGASQVTGSPLQFRRPARADHLMLLSQGYGVLDNPTMPIIGKDGREPNDTYVPQLVANAEAAIAFLKERGVGDPNRIAVGGHSYGAFMTANLLAHTNLFRAGIARSGAYNRTLTPFGFQAEPRNFWQAPDIYHSMSPFTYANQIKEPILLIHGMRDSNMGTYPVQSERMFAALKGTGGNARYVQLPLEDHGYRAKESRRHVLWEMINWLDQHVKPAKAD
jgi:dipeptidyl aminopeptidase/acylaminoacyl peptidase